MKYNVFRQESNGQCILLTPTPITPNLIGGIVANDLSKWAKENADYPEYGEEIERCMKADKFTDWTLHPEDWDIPYYLIEEVV